VISPNTSWLSRHYEKWLDNLLRGILDSAKTIDSYLGVTSFVVGTRCISVDISPSVSQRNHAVRYNSAMRSVLEADAKVNEKCQLSHHTVPKPWTNLDGDSNISLRPPREWMWNIWWKSIRPLWIYACVKTPFSWRFFLLLTYYLSIYLSIYMVRSRACFKILLFAVLQRVARVRQRQLSYL